MSYEWKIKGKTWIFGDDINTDNMLPDGFAPHGLSLEELAKWCMRPNRPGWAEMVEMRDVLVAGHNFGTGSSRYAARILKILGISCVIAESINSLMFRNCINWALPPLSCPGVTQLFVEGDITEIDLKAGTVQNLRTHKIVQGQKLPNSFLEIIAAGGIIPLLEREGYVHPLTSKEAPTDTE